MGAPQSTAPRVFVSHSHQDDAFTARLVADLRQAGADVWVDVVDAQHGNFVELINNALTSCEWMVLVLTPAALASEWVRDEVNAALTRARNGWLRGVIPVMAVHTEPRDIPPLWLNLHRYDATRDYSSALASLLRAIGLIPPDEGDDESVPLPFELPPPVPAGTIVGYGQRVEAPAWTITLPDEAPADLPPSVPAVPGGTIVGYGQRPDWPGKARQGDGFPAVADFDRAALVAERGWAIVGSSRIGLAHMYEGKYREDAIAAEIVDGKWHLAAVADGGSTYKLARLGAKVAVQSAIAAMRRALSMMGGAPGSHEARAMYVVEHGLRTAFDALHEEAQRLQEEEDRKQSGAMVTVKDLRTTLMLLLHREFPNGVHLMAGGHVGDGAVVARTIDGDETRLEWLSESDGGRLGHRVTFLTDVPNTDEDWARRVKAKLIGTTTLYCMAMTDGISDDFVPLEDNLARLEKAMFQAALGENEPAKAAEKLEDLLGYERQGSFDDRSLVCIFKQGITPWK